MDLKIEYIPVKDITPYTNNARKHEIEDVSAIANSIKEFGFSDPIGVWGNDNVIVEGHGRLQAAKMLKLKEVPVVRLDHLTDEQRRAYALAHNKTAELSDWDFDMLDTEIDNILDINMADFGFDKIDANPLDDITIDDEDIEDDRDPSCQHNVFENQEVMQFKCEGKYGIPVMQPTQTVCDKMLRFMDWKEVDNYEDYIAHFYYDDYKFMTAWRNPNKFIDQLKKFKAVVSPDFSLYTDFPIALQILSCYRRQWCGAYWQHLGLDVIPDVVWGKKE